MRRRATPHKRLFDFARACRLRAELLTNRSRETVGMRNTCLAACALVLTCFLALGTSAPAAAADAADLKPGVVLGPDNWQAAQDLLPAQILKHYETGEYK